MASAVTISHDNNVILTGSHTPKTKLWHVDIQPALQHAANAATSTASLANLVAFAHMAMFSPAISTLAEALRRGHLLEFAGLTLQQLLKHPPQSIAMIKGHLDQEQQNLRSTKQPDHSAPSTDDHFPPAENDGMHTHACYAAMLEPTGQTYMDLTGRFVAPSSTGNNYILIVYDYDSNAILAVPLKNRKSETILAAYQVAHHRLCQAGLCPKLQCLDNEASRALQDFLTDEGVDYQLVPPHLHCHNAAERAIWMFKNHFIAGLCSVDHQFPIHLWDQLIPQAELTLNLLHGSRINPKLSAWAQLHGLYDFNRTPIAPPGMRVLVHEKPSIHRTWALHAVDGWYLGPALDSY